VASKIIQLSALKNLSSIATYQWHAASIIAAPALYIANIFMAAHNASHALARTLKAMASAWRSSVIKALAGSNGLLQW